MSNEFADHAIKDHISRRELWWLRFKHNIQKRGGPHTKWTKAERRAGLLYNSMMIILMITVIFLFVYTTPLLKESINILTSLPEGEAKTLLLAAFSAPTLLVLFLFLGGAVAWLMMLGNFGDVEQRIRKIEERLVDDPETQ